MAKGARGGHNNAQKRIGNERSKATSVSDVQNFDQLESYMNSRYNITIDSDVKRLNFRAVQESLQGVEEMMNDYPELRSSISEIKTRNSGIMSCSGNAINFNPKYYNGDDADVKLNATIKSDAKSRWGAGSTVSSALGVHEAAHALIYHITQQAVAKLSPQLPLEQQKRTVIGLWNSGELPRAIVAAATQQAKKAPYGKNKTNRSLIESISKYANHYKDEGKKAHEIVAEAFSDVKENGNKAKPFSKEVYKATNAFYSEYRN